MKTKHPTNPLPTPIRSMNKLDYMDINNARMWTIHYLLTTTKDESYKTNMDKGYTILGILNNNWWYWLKCKHPKVII
jgi:hypothetical protein